MIRWFKFVPCIVVGEFYVLMVSFCEVGGTADNGGRVQKPLREKAEKAQP